MRRVLYHSAFVLAVCTLLALGVPGASAQILEQTLHGFCGTSQGTSTCSDNGTITPTSDNPLSPFGFWRSPHNNNSGLVNPTMTLEFLIPNTATVSFGAFDSGTTTGSPTSVTPTLFSPTAWTSGGLIDYLGYTQTGGPNNPIGAFLPSTNAEAPGTTGYFVYQAAFGTVDFATPPLFTDSTTLPLGTVIVGLVQWTGTGTAPSGGGNTCTSGSTCVQDATANSGAILITDDGGGGGGGGPVPEPASIMLLGSVSLLIAGIWRKKASAR